MYPDDNPNIVVTANISPEDEITQWYIDIAKERHTSPEGIPYIDDLYLDVIVSIDGNIKMIDQNELKEALDSGDITNDDFVLAYRVANEFIRSVLGKEEELKEFTMKYFKILCEAEKEAEKS